MYPVWPWLPGATNCCLTSCGSEKNSRQHAVGGVEQVLGQIVAGVHEPGGQAAPHPVDDRAAASAVPRSNASRSTSRMSSIARA